MIARLWRGWTAPEKADTYEALLRAEILPGIHRMKGYRGAYLMRRDMEGGVEFVTLTFWENMEAVRGFAGEDYETAVVPLEAGNDHRDRVALHAYLPAISWRRRA